MANDEEQYNLWVSAFSKIIRSDLDSPLPLPADPSSFSGYHYLESIQESAEEYTLRSHPHLLILLSLPPPSLFIHSGNASLEVVVKAANSKL
jgi:hypothetical protein